MKSNVQAQNVLQERRVSVADIFEVYGPLDDRIVRVLDRHATDQQAGFGIRADESVLRPLTIQRLDASLECPGLHQSGGRLPVIDK